MLTVNNRKRSRQSLPTHSSEYLTAALFDLLDRSKKIKLNTVEGLIFFILTYNMASSN